MFAMFNSHSLVSCRSTTGIMMLSVLFLMVTAITQDNPEERKRAELFNLYNGVALEGYDPVAYFKDDEPKKGRADLSVTHRGVTCHFATDENRQEFLADQDRYEPLYGGYCAYSMLDGDMRNINPDMYKIVDDRLLLFYRMRFGIVNALSRWNSEADETDGGDLTLMRRADTQWEAIYYD